MTTLTELQLELEEFTQRRRRFENLLATNPDNRAELEGRVARMLDHEDAQREILRKIEFTDKLEPLMKEAMEALDGDQTTTDDAMKWQAARGNEFAQAYLKHVNSYEYQQRSDEIEAAFAWHPAWHKSGDHSWGCDTPDDPEVWEPDKLLAQYRRHLANQH